MTKSELEALWVRAGGSKSAAGVAAAVALAESSGNPSATNNNTNGSVDRGLWQINSVHGSLSTYGELANARAAVQISSNGTNWTPWVTYNTGAYRKYLAGGGSPGGAEPSGSSGSSTSSSEPSSSGGGLTSEGLLGLGVKASLYLALLLGAVGLLWLGSKTFLEPRKAAA